MSPLQKAKPSHRWTQMNTDGDLRKEVAAKKPQSGFGPFVFLSVFICVHLWLAVFPKKAGFA
jgi:hypothetical protein